MPTTDTPESTYWPRLQRVVEHVYAHLDEPLDLNRLADIAHLSPHHWHRIYHALCGETMAATVKRLRLHRAAGWLANSELAIDQIARRSGYPNLQSFTRLFKNVYGLPPARYRAAGQHTEFTRLAPEPSTAHPLEIHLMPAIEVIAMDHVGPYMQIGRAFDVLFGQVAASGLIRPGVRMLGRFFDDPTHVPEAQLRAQACIAGCAPGGALPAPLVRTDIPAAECAVLVHTGPYASMGAAYRWLFGTWLAESGREPADAPVVEEYLNSPRDTAPADLITHIHLPLEPR